MYTSKIFKVIQFYTSLPKSNFRQGGAKILHERRFILKNKRLNELPDILTAQHIADYLTISRRRVYELFQISPEHGGIPNFEIGASKRVVKEDFMRWIERMKEKKQKTG